LGVQGVPIPSLRLVQAPVFHGYSISFWIEFEARPDPPELARTLASSYVEVRDADLDAPTNAGAAGQPGLVTGVIEADRNYPRAMWVWAVADNFRLVVDGAIDIARASGERT